MSERMTIVVGTRELLAPLRTRPEVISGAVKLFPPDDIRSALESILGQRPSYLVLDREFSRSARGTAMIERLHADPHFGSTEILVVHGDTVAPLGIPGAEEMAQNLDWRGTRRVPRIRMARGVEVQVDGAVAQLIDLSTLGAQVVSPSPLRPHQRVRFNLPGDTTSRMVATVAWVNFELPKGRPAPHYRAGLEFSNPGSQTLEQFCAAHAFADPGGPA